MITHQLRIWVNLLPALLVLLSADIVLAGSWLALCFLNAGHFSLELVALTMTGLAFWGLALLSQPDLPDENCTAIAIVGGFAWGGIALYSLNLVTPISVYFAQNLV